jgi:hypothetical protein
MRRLLRGAWRSPSLYWICVGALVVAVIGLLTLDRLGTTPFGQDVARTTQPDSVPNSNATASSSGNPSTDQTSAGNQPQTSGSTNTGSGGTGSGGTGSGGTGSGGTGSGGTGSGGTGGGGTGGRHGRRRHGRRRHGRRRHGRRRHGRRRHGRRRHGRRRWRRRRYRNCNPRAAERNPGCRRAAASDGDGVMAAQAWVQAQPVLADSRLGLPRTN